MNNWIKNAISVTFVLFLLINMSLTVHAEEHTVEYDGATYTYSDAGVLTSVENAIGAVDLAAFAKANNIVLKVIGQGAFKYNNITSVNIPASIMIIADWAFDSCGSLSKVTYEDGSKLSAIGLCAFCQNNALSCFCKKGDSAPGTFDFPDELTTIGELAFQSTKPKKIILPQTCETIGDSAFAYVDNASVTVYSDTVVIGKDVFESTTTIYANPDSYAATYAGANGITCEPIENGTGNDGGNNNPSQSETETPDDNKQGIDEKDNESTQPGNNEETGGNTGKTGEDGSGPVQTGNETTDENKQGTGGDNDGQLQPGNKETGDVNPSTDNQASQGGNSGSNNQQNNNPIIINVDNSANQNVTVPNPVVIVNPSQNDSGQTQTEQKQADQSNTGDQQTETPVVYEALGSKHMVDGLIYKVVGQGKVSFLKPENKNIKKLVIPDTIMINNVEYQVTEVAAKACYKLKKLNNVTVGKYVTVIRKQAFQECKNLKKVTLGRYLKTIETKCFYNDKKLIYLNVYNCIDLKKVGKKAIHGRAKAFSLHTSKGYRDLYVKLFKKAQ